KSIDVVIERAKLVGSNNPIHTYLFSVGYPHPQNRISHLLAELEALKAALESVDAELAGRATDWSGPNAYPNFAPYVRRLKPIFERMTGKKATASFSPNAPGGGMRFGPFVRFVWLLALGLPRDFRPKAKVIGEAVNRALRDLEG